MGVRRRRLVSAAERDVRGGQQAARPRRDEGLYKEYGDELEKLCVEVLREMAAAGSFDIGLCYIGGDNSPEEFLRWARQVNPQTLYRRVRREYLASVPQ